MIFKIPSSKTMLWLYDSMCVRQDKQVFLSADGVSASGKIFVSSQISHMQTVLWANTSATVTDASLLCSGHDGEEEKLCICLSIALRLSL